MFPATRGPVTSERLTPHRVARFVNLTADERTDLYTLCPRLRSIADLPLLHRQP
jgi:hypothetical protein